MAVPTPSVLRRPQLSSSTRAKRKRSFSARPFFATILLVCAIAAVSLFLDPSRSPAARHASPLSPRGLAVNDEECRLVHHAPDKCAFVRANCPDEEAGIFSYLQLYYCRLPHAKPFAFAILVAWLAMLFSTIGIAASDFFCVNLSTISSLLGMSESMAGVTFLAFGNGSPDVFSTFAAMKTNSGSLAVGELIGAAGFITAVVAGSMALVRPFKVDRRSFVRDVSFFIFAAAFSMVFLIDGKLSLWECAAMVGFYIAYVLFVLCWHWWHGRRQRRRHVEAMARAHFVTPGGEEAEVFEPYHDEEDASVDGRNRHSRNASVDDLLMLEQNNSDDEDLGFERADEEVRERWLGELNRNMRLSRPRLGERRNTRPPPIRPSLVGALEFRAVMTSLKKSRNIQSMPINLRRYSDDPTFTTAQQQDHMSSISDPAARPPYEVATQGQPDATPTVTRPNLDVRTAGGYRLRAVSANDADGLMLDPGALRSHITQQQDLLGPLDEDNNSLRVPPNNSRRASDASSRGGRSPAISLSPSPSQPASRGASPAIHQHRRSLSPDHLAPPDQLFAPGPQQGSHLSATSSTAVSPKQLPKLEIPASAQATQDLSPFPAYRDYGWSINSGSRPGSLRLVSPSASPVSLFPNEHFPEMDDEEKPPSWWPSRILPTPQRLLSKLFPTLCNFWEKSIWGKLLGIVAAPSVFLLTITLPVVEGDKDEDEEDSLAELNLPSPIARTPVSNHRSAPSTITVIAPDDDPPAEDGHPRTESIDTHGVAGHGSTAGIAAAHETQHRTAYHDRSPMVIISPSVGPMHQSPEEMPRRPQTANSSSEPKEWDRWLVILQIFTAPLFVIIIFWANFEMDNPRALIRPTLISLACSLAVLLLLLATTTPDRPPKWRNLLCFAGFVVAIAWISTIANEVVGVLKTLGAILNISDAILGLTIFAVGNSLGDLVADITVARLGFPVMALSACFGGPMLNILLGIGLSGCYMTIKKAENKHEKHPDHPLHFKPYHLDISSTLIVSGATLLVTLLGLLVMVPMRKWRMDRVIGCSLVVLWTVSTIGNVVAEVLGWGDDNIN
ncbi:sodium calcium exchanger protein [Botryosphaeria dothidea]|uniref:Sodium calcium exchanger protein n=1 Tax=Botryosphaeria dothidea TaxID=55169 RepID=A0A8H4IXQ2_9PEZI|nr:sodium calcium exchanger protein [Botryosphaeria dothidea]